MNNAGVSGRVVYMSKREFELDLTSVCVATGVMQLPLKMQQMFATGELPAVVDGEEMVVDFAEPRRLSGFKEHFERRGLRCNDKVRFEVEVDGDRAVALVAASIKRERNKPAQPVNGAVVEPNMPSESATGQRGEGSDRTPSSWGDDDFGGQVRAVRRIRIEGGAPLSISGSAHYLDREHGSGPRDVSSSGEVHEPSANGRESRPAGGPARASRWAPLDEVSFETYQAPVVSQDFAETTVREIRKSRGTVDDLAVGGGDQQQTSDVVTAIAAAVDESALQLSFGDEPVAADTLTQHTPSNPMALPRVDAVEPAHASGESLDGAIEAPKLAARPRIPVPRNTAAGSDWQPTPASDLEPTDTTSTQRQPRLIEERELVPVRAAYQPRTTGLEALHSGTPSHADGNGEATTSRQPHPREHAAFVIDDSEFGGEHLPAGTSFTAAMSAKAEEDPRSRVEEPPSSADPVAEHATPLASPPPPVEDDLRLVENYLSRPNTPAIVRSEIIAAELGIDDQRSERALERLSEDRDRVSRIRKGAYMVKSIPSGHSHRL